MNDVASEFNADLRYFIRAEFDQCYRISPRTIDNSPSVATVTTPAMLTKLPECTKMSCKFFDMRELFVFQSQTPDLPAPLVTCSVRVPSRCCFVKPKDLRATIGANSVYLCEKKPFIVTVQVDNTSNATFSDIAIEMICEVLMKAPEYPVHVASNRILYQKIEPVPGHIACTGADALKVTIELPAGIQQSITASLFDVMYKLVLRGQIKHENMHLEETVIVCRTFISQAEHLETIQAPPGWERIDPSIQPLLI